MHLPLVIFQRMSITLFCLIPKVNNAAIITQYRPTSHCKIYKIITKILVNHLNPLLDRVISLTQSIFQKKKKKKLASDNAIIVQEIINYFKHKKGNVAHRW